MNDAKQSFEVWAAIRAFDRVELMRYRAVWEQAYEAGEIAMREKAAQRIHHAFCRTIERMQNICDCDDMAEAIRELPLSGAAPEEKKAPPHVSKNEKP